jgi:hypothetical protein
VLTISYKAIPASRRRTAPTGLVRPTGKRIAGDIRTFAAIGVHDLIFDFRGQSTAESIEPAKVRHGGHPARGGLTTVRAAVMVGSGAQPRFAGADLVRLSELPIYSTSVKQPLYSADLINRLSVT